MDQEEARLLATQFKILGEKRVLPRWIILIYTLVFFTVAFTALAYTNRRYKLARLRAANHICLHCGYDLRATPTRCPECGEVPYKRLDLQRLKSNCPTQKVLIEQNVPDEFLTAVIHETTEQNEARLLSLQLVLRGVPARRSDSKCPGEPLLTLFKVSVRETDRPTARKIMQMFE